MLLLPLPPLLPLLVLLSVLVLLLLVVVLRPVVVAVAVVVLAAGRRPPLREASGAEVWTWPGLGPWAEAGVRPACEGHPNSVRRWAFGEAEEWMWDSQRRQEEGGAACWTGEGVEFCW